MPEIGIGLIGCGEIADLHAQALQGIAGARIVAAYDLQPDRSGAFADKFNVKSAVNVEDLLANPEVQAVYVMTRHDSHAAYVLKALEAGKHVFCEKPLALTEEDARKVYRAARGSKTYLMVGFNHRWGPAVQSVRAYAKAQNTLIRLVQVTFATAPFLENWGGLPIEGGGVFPCLGSHALDLACYLADDEPVRVTALGARLRLTGPYLDDTGAALIQTRSGALCSVTFHDHAPASYVNYATGMTSHLVRAEVFGDGWAAVVDDIQKARYFDSRGCREDLFPGDDPLTILGIAQEDAHFVNCLLAGQAPSPDFREGLRAFRVVKAALDSAREERTLPVEGVVE
ncbi:MAG: Gfo/Idh/MocA family oxidoreductase [Chloroflexi bacterium]|nr:Gfo/Idh/MocA family oxidoreductase [Chloroflexota bacterium]